MEVLESRGFDIDYCLTKGVGYCSGGQYMQRIIVPFYRNGICRYYQGRTFIDHPIKYFNPRKELVGIGKEDIIYNEDALYMFPKVYIMEGALDALSVGEDATSRHAGVEHEPVATAEVHERQGRRSWCSSRTAVRPPREPPTIPLCGKGSPNFTPE